MYLIYSEITVQINTNTIPQVGNGAFLAASDLRNEKEHECLQRYKIGACRPRSHSL